MSKLTFLAIVAIAIGIFGGVLEVKVHTDKLSEVPGVILGMVQDGSLYEKGRQYVTNLKRSGEFMVIKDEKQRLELAAGYIETDAKRLNDLLEEKKSAEDLMPQAELLSLSIERAGDLTEKAHVDNIAALGDKTKVAFTTAAETVNHLKEVHQSYAALEEKFATIVGQLEKHIGTIKPESKDGAVAGSQDESAASPNPTIPPIQLNF